MAKTGPGNCSVCRHKHRHTIDMGIVAGVSSNVLASRFDLQPDAILRHSHNHLSPVQRAALLTASQPTAIDLEQLRTSESEGLLASLVAQRARLAGYGEVAAELGDINAATRVEGAILANLQTVGKLLQQFVQIHDVRHSSILISPDYLALRTCLVDTLRAFPDAGLAVAKALHRMETEAAETITSRAAKPMVAAHKVIEHNKSVTRTDLDVGGLDLALGEAERGEHLVKSNKHQPDQEDIGGISAPPPPPSSRPPPTSSRLPPPPPPPGFSPIRIIPPPPVRPCS